MKTRHITCGWCMTGRHDSCPGTTRNGDDSLVSCSCTTLSTCGRLRCTECFEDNPEHVGTDGHCLDTTRCQARRELSLKIARKGLNLDDVQVIASTRSINLKEFDMARTASNKAAATTKTKKVAQRPTANEKGINFLIEQVAEKTGRNIPGAQLRVLLRRLVKDGVIERGEGRWTFSGVSDPAVKEVIKAVKAGDLDKANKEKIGEAKKAAKKNTRAKAKVEEDEDLEIDDELDEITDEDLEDIDLDEE